MKKKLFLSINKKGSEEGETTMMNMTFVAVSFIIGAFLIGATAIFVVNSMNGSPENILAKDIALTISTMMSASSDMYYKYSPNTEQYTVAIENNGEVEVIGEGKGNYKAIPMTGMSIKKARLVRVLSIPIKVKDNVLSFDDLSQEKEDLCDFIPSNFPSETNVYISVKATSKESMDILNSIKEKIIANMLASNTKIKSVDTANKANIVLTLEFRDDSAIVVEYFSNEDISNHQRIACFMASELYASLSNEGSDIKYVAKDNDKQVMIVLGSLENFKNLRTKKPSIVEDFSTAIFKGLSEAIINE